MSSAPTITVTFVRPVRGDPPSTTAGESLRVPSRYGRLQAMERQNRPSRGGGVESSTRKVGGPRGLAVVPGDYECKQQDFHRLAVPTKLKSTTGRRQAGTKASCGVAGLGSVGTEAPSASDSLSWIVASGAVKQQHGSEPWI